MPRSRVIAAVMVNRSQALVLFFVAAAVVVLLLLLFADPAIYADSLRPLPQNAWTAFVFFALLTAFLSLLTVGVIRRWRWIFWLVVIAFCAGVLRVPASALELTGGLPATGPSWYEILQGAIGIVQFVIGLVLIRGYRREGPWGRF
jgi:hypothetical protein